MTVGDNIKQLRKKRKLTQQELADQIDISRNYLSELENNKRNLSIDTLEKLAQKLNINLNFLLSGSYDDYAEYLLSTLESELIENKQVSDKVIPFIASDMRSHLFPFLHSFKTMAEADKIYNEYKPILIERWTEPSSIEHYLLDNASNRISDIIVKDTIPYMYTDFYTGNDSGNISENKLTKNSETLIRKLHDLDNLQRVYMDKLRFIDNDGILNELDELNEFSDRNTI